MLGPALMQLRKASFAALYRTGTLRGFLKGGGVQYFALAYHGVSEMPSPLFTSRKLFASHLEMFSDWGKVASINELESFARTGAYPDGPKLRFVITFDDGYANVVTHAAPILRKYDARATVYVNPGWIEREAIPWWFQLSGAKQRARVLREALAREGYGGYPNPETSGTQLWPMALIQDIISRVPQEEFARWWNDRISLLTETDSALNSEGRLGSWSELRSALDVLDVGSHTQSHAILGLCRDDAFLRQEISLSKKAIETNLNRPCPHFAFPRGESTDYNDKVQELLKVVGHRTAVTTEGRKVEAGENPFAIPRFYLAETTVAEVAAILTGFQKQWDRKVDGLRNLARRRKANDPGGQGRVNA